MMEVKPLPNYTTERFYLLSELEQLCDFVYLDESPGLEMRFVGGNACYLLWNLVEDEVFESIDAKLQSLNRFFSANNIISQNTFISIEVFIKATQTWDSCGEKDVVEQAFQKILRNYDFGALCIGLSTNMASTAALEATMDWLAMLNSVDSNFSARGNLIALERSHMLGFDALREPDAASNVLQILLCSKSDRELKIFCAKIVQNLMMEHGHKQVTGDMKCTREVDPWESFVLWAAAAFVACIAVSFYAWLRLQHNYDIFATQ